MQYNLQYSFPQISMSFIHLVLLMQLLLVLKTAEIKNISNELFPYKNLVVPNAFSLKIHQSNLKNQIRLDLKFDPSANNVILSQNIQQNSVTRQSLSHGPLRVGVLKRIYAMYSVYFRDDLTSYTFENDDVGKLVKVMQINATTIFTFFYHPVYSSPSNISSVLSFTGLLSYPLLSNSSCKITKLKIVHNNTEFCIDNYDIYQLKYLKNLFGFSFPKPGPAIKESHVIWILVILGILAFFGFIIVIYYCIRYFIKHAVETGVPESKLSARASLLNEAGEPNAETPFNDDVNERYHKIKSLLTRQVEEASATFHQQLKRAIQIRNENISLIEQLIQSESQSTQDTDTLCSVCETIKSSTITLAVCGQLNTGKSMLVSALLDWKIHLPSLDEATTRRITRFVYSDTPVVKLLRTDNEEVRSDELIEDSLVDYICLSDDEEKSTDIVQVEYPSDLLKSGLVIIDFPGFNENVSMNEAMLHYLKRNKPSILCYVYDHRMGISLRDCDQLMRIMNTFDNVEYETILVANKCDSFDENLIDATEKTGRLNAFDQTEENRMFQNNFQSQYFQMLFRFNFDKILPIQPLSTAKLLLREISLDNDNNTSVGMKMFDNFRSQILSKIIYQSRYALLRADNISSDNVDLYFLLKKLMIEDDLIELVIENCCSDSDKDRLLIDFSHGYQLFALNHPDTSETVHVTVISNEAQFHEVKMRVYYDMPVCGNYSIYPLSFVNEANSSIYWIERLGINQKRLVDHLSDCSMNDVIAWIKTIHDYKDNIKSSFRPDNIYVNEQGSIHISNSVPNNPQLPLILKHQNEVRPSFHIHPELKSLYPYFHHKRRQDFIDIEFIYSFGWMIWILMDGTGAEPRVDPESPDVEQWIQMLQNGRFPNYPKDFNKVLKICFEITTKISSTFPIETEIRGIIDNINCA